MGGGSRPSPLQQTNSVATSVEQDSLAPVRPIRLLERPERITATAEVPDGAPIQFTWRRVTYHVVHAEGPERIAMEWWRDDKGDAVTRDYFRVESRDGVRLWLYRQGFFDDLTPPTWFLHGIFA
jgi:protein ImuB